MKSGKKANFGQVSGKLVMKSSTPRPRIRKHLLWEYDWESFDFDRSAAVVIERVIERGNMEDWREMLRYYGVEKVLEVA
jgi:hypothetical protein